MKSDAAGHYEFVGIPAGTYELLFESPGMAYLKREGLALAAGQASQVNAVMKIGSLEETITVTSAPDGRPLATGYRGARPADKPDACAQSTAGGCIRPPVKTKDVRPVYPPGSNGGQVFLKALIDANGLVAKVDVDNSSGPDPVLAEAAAAAVRQWEFTSTHLDGEPIEVNMKVQRDVQEVARATTRGDCGGNDGVRAGRERRSNLRRLSTSPRSSRTRRTAIRRTSTAIATQ